MSFALAVIVASLGLNELPPIQWKPADEVEADWRAVRKLTPAAARVRAVYDRGLRREACSGLVDMRALAPVAAAGLGWKDAVRGRGWARPTLARLLAKAHRAWRGEDPKRQLIIGDVAQAGCGFVEPGMLARLWSADEAQPMLARAEPVVGTPLVREVVPASELPDRWRFRSGARVLIETELVASDAASGQVLAHVRRYEARSAPDAAALALLEREVAFVVTHGELVHEARDATEVRQHWVEASRHRQVVIVRAPGRFALADARDIRMGPWALARPGVFRSETRWLREGDGWARWQLLEEGAHATHMAGRDADLSYPMSDPAQGWRDAVGAIDVHALWRWFEALQGAGDALGTPLSGMLVGPSVFARLMREVPEAKASPLITERVVRVVAGHDDHQHLVLALPSPEADRAARAALLPSVGAQR